MIKYISKHIYMKHARILTPPNYQCTAICFVPRTPL